MPATIAIKTAETADERDRIFRFRYDVYVDEMGKKPSVADHRNRVICDELDDGAHQECPGSQMILMAEPSWDQAPADLQHSSWPGIGPISIGVFSQHPARL